MAGPTPSTSRLFISYAHEDRALGEEFKERLDQLHSVANVAVWLDDDIALGKDWYDEILRELEAADVIVLLVSRAFLASDFIREEELPRAIERRRAGKARLIPILLHECPWRDTALKDIQGLPDGMNPFGSQRRAQRLTIWSEIAQRILDVVKDVAATRARADRRRAEAGPTPEQYLVQRASQYKDFENAPLTNPDLKISAYEQVERLRFKLLHGVKLPKPIRITVRGTLFPCALLTSGWWERHVGDVRVGEDWDDKVQQWLFNGFDLWAPSWDFTWAIEAARTDQAPTRFVAQLGTGDEADSLPVFLAPELARRLAPHFSADWGGVEAEVTGLLGHRRHFKRRYKDADSFGGMLDFCLWVEDHPPRHRVDIPKGNPATELYSGYVWKCVAPLEKWLHRRPLSLRDVYFIWDHTNFAKKSAVAYSLEALEHKERYIERQIGGPLVLLQKSSGLVAGECKFSPTEAYDIIIRGGKKTV
jgi:hypothetical protein